jgi:RNA polymerase sigma factor (sigma-70 family)
MDEQSPSFGSHRPALTNDAEDVDRRVRDREYSAFYRQSIVELVNFLIWQGARPADAAENAQEAMIKAHTHWDTISEPRAWVRRVASREWGRRFARAQEDPVDHVPEHTSLLHTDTAIESVAERHDVLRLLETLPPRQRQVMAWTMDGFSGPEIADELGINPDAVRSSLLKARRALASRLGREGGLG